ncbi:MAG: hypothetical protein NUV76_12085 [Candidatus Kuenenia sp.]|nr:hypothetical protein [Candidatus Kuenenia sp.]
MRDFCKNKDDYIGHGATRFYYDFDGGMNRECTDFSDPANFPTEIVVDIKAGKFRGLGITGKLLRRSALAEYKKIRQSALEEYEKVRQSAFWDLFKIKKHRNKLWI